MDSHRFVIQGRPVVVLTGKKGPPYLAYRVGETIILLKPDGTAHQLNNVRCSCPGFRYRQRCKHSDPAVFNLESLCSPSIMQTTTQTTTPT
jgi:hypothetical protein